MKRMAIEFFEPMQPPTITHQQHKVGIRRGKPYFYDPPELKDARMKLGAYLAKHVPEKPIVDGVRLTVKWCFPVNGQHRNGEYRTSKPDTDNLQKLLKDVMTELGFWKDDALVASELVEKFWADMPGIYVRIEPLGG